MQRLALAGEVCLAISNFLSQTYLAASPETSKYSGDFGWVSVYLHRRRKLGDRGNEYGNRSNRHALDSVRRETLAAGHLKVGNAGNHGFEMQIREFDVC